MSQRVTSTILIAGAGIKSDEICRVQCHWQDERLDAF